ncbi:MAG: hypothetical protein JSR67_00100 [Proteobacteria bacterium]|nr:hypothetical protein [Pseudomonadota bacterium]
MTRSANAPPPWYRQRVLWLAAALLAASIAGCLWMIVLGVRHADQPLPGVGEQVLRVPLTRPPPGHD